MEVRRKVVGRSEIVTETIRKTVATKNTKTETVIRSTVACIVLDCGHKIAVTSFLKVPRNNTRCRECESAQPAMKGD